MLKLFLSLVLIFMMMSEVAAQLNGTTIHTKSEKDLVPEGIAVDSRNGKIYVSSIAKHKIIVIDTGGGVKDFITSDAYGFLEGLGMKVDTARNLLWALSVKTTASNYTSKVHAFDLRSGVEAQSYMLSDTVPHMFNDLDIDKEGNIYITDTYFNAIYHIDPKTKTLALFLKTPDIQSPNGIAIGNNRLYIATYGSGLIQADLATKTTSSLTGYTNAEIAHGLDGLVYYNNSLAGVYNYSTLKNSFDTAVVIKYSLDETGRKITGETLIDKNNPLFMQPTTCSMSAGWLFVLANSYLGIYNSNKQSTKGMEKELSPVTITGYRMPG